MPSRVAAGVRLIVAMWASAVMFTVLTVMFSSQQRASRVGVLFAILVFAAMGMTVVGALMVRSGRRELKRMVERSGNLLCPKCHYSLEVPLKEEGSSCQCPECGQRWEREAVIQGWAGYR